MLYDDAYERVRQHHNPSKRKRKWNQKTSSKDFTKSKSLILRKLILKNQILFQTELERLETSVVDTRNMYILHVNQMNYALKFYIEQFIVDLDKVERFYFIFSLKFTLKLVTSL